ncbi:MAG: HU family DNA-binding protein [Prevotella sp.]|uniref:HU family DNA-binding protein n=1 Tax=Prevotella sp. AGR2160 TaxID=1280674 RepID=UPI00041D3487|nr:HU family DNA-binding protein [Prevotella sp. AGR2160]MDD5861574.1 HU family DNA-binding protein [Prevotella sp.]
MNNKEFIAALAAKTGYTQEDTQKLCTTLIDALADEVETSGEVGVTGFGTFEVRKRMERIIVNPSTKQRMLVPPKLVLNFRPVASLKEKLKNGDENIKPARTNRTGKEDTDGTR